MAPRGRPGGRVRARLRGRDARDRRGGGGARGRGGGVRAARAPPRRGLRDLPPPDLAHRRARRDLRPALLPPAGAPRAGGSAPDLLRAGGGRHGAPRRGLERDPLPHRLGGDGARELLPRPHRARSARGPERGVPLSRLHPRRDARALRGLRAPPPGGGLLRLRRDAGARGGRRPRRARLRARVPRLRAQGGRPAAPLLAAAGPRGGAEPPAWSSRPGSTGSCG